MFNTEIPNHRENEHLQTRHRFNPSPHRSSPFNYHWNTFENQKATPEFWCETCDRGFKNQYQLNNHKKEHEKCNIEGCQFVAHPKVITKHIQMQHSTGLYSKISKLQEPEEIIKWREERKRKYPTKVNIDKKNAEVKEKNNRGEKMGIGFRPNGKSAKMSQLGRKEQKFNNSYHNKNSKRNINKPIACLNKKKHIRKTSNSVLTEQKETQLQPFTGIQQLINNDFESDNENAKESCPIDDDDDWLEVKEDTKEESKVCGALSSLICDYESSEEDNIINNNDNQKKTEDTNIRNEETNISDNVTYNMNVKEGSKNIEALSDDSGPEEEKIIKESNSNNIFKEVIEKSSKPNTFKKPIIKCKQKINFNKKKLPSTLLEKLLFKEIKHERNIILQCIRHITKSNYFEDVQKRV